MNCHIPLFQEKFCRGEVLSNQSLLRFIDTDQSFGKKFKNDKNDGYCKIQLFIRAGG